MATKLPTVTVSSNKHSHNMGLF